MGGDTFNQAFTLGIAAYQQGRYKAALRRIDAALALNAKAITLSAQ